MTTVPPNQPGDGAPEESPLPGSGAGQSQDAPPQFGVPTFGAPPADAPPPYGAPPPDASPYGSPPGSAMPPYGAPPAGGPVYDAPPYGSQPYGAQPYGAQPYGAQPYGTAVYTGGPGPWMGGGPCPSCGQQLGQTVACLYCKQVANMPPGYQLASAGERFGQYLLDGLLLLVTALIGWLIWSFIIWKNGQTPAMQILKMRCVKKDTGQIATWGTMALRELVGKFLIMSAIGLVFFPAQLVLDFMLLWDKDRQQLWDKVAGTIVVDDPVIGSGQTALPPAA